MNPKTPSSSPFNAIFTFLTVPPARSAQLWDAVFAWGLAALFFLTAFLPDERLVRTKLLTLEAGICVASFAFFLRAVWRGQLKLSKATLLAAAAGLVAFVAARAAFAENPALGGVEIRRALLMLGAFWTADQVLDVEGGRRKVLMGWGLGAGLIALYGILQYFGGVGPVLVPQMDRVQGTFGNPIFFGTYLAVSLPILWGLWLSAEKGGERLLWTAAIAAGVAALYLTRSRAAWIGFSAALAAGLFILYGRKRTLLAALTVLAIIVGVFVWKTQDTWTRDQAHLQIWRDTVKLWKTAPLVGVGPGEFHVHFPDVAGEDLKSKWPEGKFIVNYAHNEYLQILAEMGLIGLALWLLMAGIFFWGQIVAMLPVGPQSRARTGGIPKRMFTNQSRFSVNFPDLDPERASVFCAVAAIFAQAAFSVDLRFSVSAGLLFFLMGSVASGRSLEFYWRASWPLRAALVLAALWSFVLVGIRLIQPYKAQREHAKAVNFFDQRLLDPAKTIEDLEELVGEYPKESLVWEKLAYVYAKEIQGQDADGRPVVRRDMADKSIAAYERVTRMDPARPGPYNNLGNIHFTIGDRAKAVEYWQKAVEVDPAQLDAHLNLGKVFYLEGKLKPAAEQFKKVMEIDPANAEASVYLRKMVE